MHYYTSISRKDKGRCHNAQKAGLVGTGSGHAFLTVVAAFVLYSRDARRVGLTTSLFTHIRLEV